MKKILVADATISENYANFGFNDSIEIARQLEKLKVDIIELPRISSAAKDGLLIKTISSFVKSSVLSVDGGVTS